MQAFYDADRHWTDSRAALLWDMQRSINEELRRRGQRTFNDDVAVTKDMVVMLHVILSLALNEGVECKTHDALFTWLVDAKPRYLRNLEASPDGTGAY